MRTIAIILIVTTIANPCFAGEMKISSMPDAPTIFSSMYAKRAIGKVTISERLEKANLWYSWPHYHRISTYIDIGLNPLPSAAIFDHTHCTTLQDGAVRCRVKFEEDYV